MLCTNQMKQIGLSMHHFNNTHERFPPGEVSTTAVNIERYGPRPTHESVLHQVPGNLMLPYLEEADVANLWE